MPITAMAGGGVIATGHGVTVYQALVVKNAIKMWLKHRVKANRAYTPTNMAATAGRITGKTYKRGQLAQAQADLEQWIQDQRAVLAAEAEQAEGVTVQ